MQIEEKAGRWGSLFRRAALGSMPDLLEQDLTDLTASGAADPVRSGSPTLPPPHFVNLVNSHTRTEVHKEHKSSRCCILQPRSIHALSF